MNAKVINEYVKNSIRSSKLLNIRFKDRPMKTCLFVCSNDYEDLKSKNFWRVVDIAHVEEFVQTGNVKLTRIFSGASFVSMTSTAHGF